MNISKIATGALFQAIALPSVAFAAAAVAAPGTSFDAPPGFADNAENIILNEDEAATTQNVRFTLSNVTVEHPGLKLNDRDIAAFTENLMGKETNAKELNVAVTEITKYVRANGYPAATAYIPTQKAVDGNLLIRIEVGRYGKIIIDNQSKIRNRIVEGLTAGLKGGQPIKTAQLETVLYNLRDLYGIEVVGVLSPGESQGASDLTVKIMNRKNTSFILYGENYGSRSTGRYRYGMQGNMLNPFGVGDKFDLGFMLSNARQRNYNFGYEMPAGHSATKVGIGFSKSDYELGSVFSALGAEGKADTLSLYGKTPLVNTATNSCCFTYGYDYRVITDELIRYNFSWKKHSHAVNMGFDGSTRNNNSSFSYNVRAHAGTLTPDSDAADFLASAGDTKGHFCKGAMNISYWQRLGKRFDMTLKLSGQKAATNLDSSEHLYLGGAKGVRAYPQGEASGDEGVLGTVEMRYLTPLKGLSLAIFYDAGHVNIAKSGDNGNMTLQGWGLSAMYAKRGDFFARIDYARRIGSDNLMSNVAEAKNRIWFLAGKMF